MPISPQHKTPSYQRLFHESRRRLFDDPTGSLSVRKIHGFENRKWQQQNLMSGISKNERSERLFESVETRSVQGAIVNFVAFCLKYGIWNSIDRFEIV